MKEKVRFTLTSKILLAMVAGIAAGLTAKYIFPDSGFVHTYIIEGLFLLWAKSLLTALS